MGASFNLTVIIPFLSFVRFLFYFSRVRFVPFRRFELYGVACIYTLLFLVLLTIRYEER